MNPVIKFTTLFGLLAVEIAVTMQNKSLKTGIGVVFFLIALCFVYRSFYGMRIPAETSGSEAAAPRAQSTAGEKVLVGK
jgi:K(+)-stimulated pyrophosphate-energized sodium pump